MVLRKTIKNSCKIKFFITESKMYHRASGKFSAILHASYFKWPNFNGKDNYVYTVFAQSDVAATIYLVLSKFTRFETVSGYVTLITIYNLSCTVLNIRESVDSPCRDGADAQYMQCLSKSRITSPQTRKKLT